MDNNAMDETEFLALANAMLETLCDAIEEADQGGIVDCELSEGILNIVIETDNVHKVYVINRHVPMRQIWWSSPISGGLHFDYVDAQQGWISTTGVELTSQLEKELSPYIPFTLR